MTTLRFTLVAEGTSDRVLIPILRWMLLRHHSGFDWLLVSESALRGASGNPNGRNPLQLPPMRDLEKIPDPKEVLRDLLVEASGLSGRRRKQINFFAQRARVPDFLENWEPLLRLPSAQQLHNEIAALTFD